MIQRDFLERRHAQNLQKSGERNLDCQALLDDGHEDVNRDGDPNLRLHRILRGPIKRLNPQVLFDPAKEKFDVPPELIEHRDGQRRKDKIIRQKGQIAAVLPVVVADAAKFVGISVVGIKTYEGNGLVADQVRGSIDGPRRQAAAAKIRFGANDEEGLALMDGVEAGEVEIASIEEIEAAGLGNEVIQNPDIVDFSLCNLDKRRDGAPQIHQRMKLDGGLAFAEDGPRKKGKAEVDRGGVESVDGLLQFQAEIIVGIESAGLMNKNLGEVGVNPPIAGFISVGQGVSRDVAADAHVIESIPHRTQTGLDITETFPKSQLSEAHAEELIETRKASNLVVAAVAPDAFPKLIKKQEIHNLGKNG